MLFRNRVRDGGSSQPRSLIFVSIKKAYYSSIVILVLSRPVSEILQVYSGDSNPTFISPEFLGCFPWTRSPILGLREAKTPC